MDSFRSQFDGAKLGVVGEIGDMDELASYYGQQCENWVKAEMTLAGLKNQTVKVSGTEECVSSIEARLGDANSVALTLKPRLQSQKVVLKCLKNTELKTLYGLMSTYADLYLTTETFTMQNSALIKSYCMHAVNHVLKTRDLILKNNAKLSKFMLTEKAGDSVAGVSEVVDNELDESDDSSESDSDSSLVSGDCVDKLVDGDALRDQGFTRPKVLILVPLKNTAFRVIKTVLDIVCAEQVENKKRFEDEFGPDPSRVNIDEEVNTLGKPRDFVELFCGNNDDHFRVGIKINRKSVKLFASFYSSDILVASPLGLRTLIGSEDSTKAQDYDFLSSIEVCVVDQAEVIEMQNFEHLLQVFKHVNEVPKSPRDIDFSRVKDWYLDRKARLLRQTIVCSSLQFPSCNALVSRFCKNVTGMVRVVPAKKQEAIINKSFLSLPQIFYRLKRPSTPLDDADCRFDFFCRNCYPRIKKSNSATLLVVPQYFDFVRLRNWLTSQDAEFGQLSEYKTNSEISRTRSRFFQKRFTLLLTTERFHFYNRYLLRGAHQIFFYSLPMMTSFYTEYLAMLHDACKEAVAEVKVELIFSLWDKLSLERLVGTEKCRRMLRDSKDVFRFI